MKKRLLVLSLYFMTAMLSGMASAATLNNDDAVRQLSDQFMEEIQKGHTARAYGQVMAYVGVDKKKFKEVGKQSENYIKNLYEQLGPPVSADFLSVQRVGDHFMKVTYLLKFQAAAIVWEIKYYQPTDGWKLVDISTNIDIDKLFK